MNLLKLAALFRAAYFLAHEAHHQAKGDTFYQDHGVFGDLYVAYEDAYDSLVERAIGLDMDVKETLINTEALAKYKEKANADTDYFTDLLAMEKAIAAACESCCKGETAGTMNLLQGLADSSEARTYKIKRRLGL